MWDSGNRVWGDHVDKGFSYMYICGSCRGAAVTIMEPGLVGVLQWAPLNDFYFYLFASVAWGVDII